VLLLRSTLITLNDAIQTGNFTVLRDMGAPGFRDANSPARLSRAFTDLASRGVDLSAVSVITPQLMEAPTLDQQKGMLHLKGISRVSRYRSISRCFIRLLAADGGYSASVSVLARPFRPHKHRATLPPRQQPSQIQHPWGGKFGEDGAPRCSQENIVIASTTASAASRCQPPWPAQAAQRHAHQ
jgi:hypothetical protein